MSKVLILDDEEDIRGFIIINLKRSGYEVIEASTGEEAIDIFAKEDIDIAVLDVMLPGIDGFEVCQKMREQDKKVGIIMLTAKGQELDKVNGLTFGADDYVVKPFSPSELVARIDSLNRRVSLLKKDEENIVSGPFKVDLKKRILSKNGTEINLTQIEFEVVKLFMQNEDKALSREHILDKIWGENYFGNYKTVDVNIRRIRQKIEDNPSDPEFITTIWGYGYRWRKEE